eukprot:Skav219650  [mRNA]  locus=scaffold628:434172:435399:- [translate_table: standard]
MLHRCDRRFQCSGRQEISDSERAEPSSQTFGSMAAALGAALLVGLAAGFALRPGKIEPEAPQALPVQAAEAETVPTAEVQTASYDHCTAWLLAIAIQLM